MELKISECPALFQSSGINSSFHGNEGSFQDYSQHAENIIATGRVDLTAQNAHKIIDGNRPFEWRPAQKTKKGILLVHGLFDSPYTLRDLGQYFLTKNFLVRGLLLPGHGTVPADLLYTDYHEWLKAVDFGMTELAKEVSELYILGYSLGGTLAIHQALNTKHALKALFLLAPALRPRRPFVDFLLHLHKMICFFCQSRDWYQLEKQTSYVRYESFACNAADQACHLMKQTKQSLKRKSIEIPLCVILSEDDESTHAKAAMRFFKKQSNPHNKLLLYSNRPHTFSNHRMIIRPSAFPEQRILNIAHTGLAIAPTNAHYGQNGEFKDFQHYHYDIPKNADIYLGAITKENLKKYTIQRLSYNPDFSGMLSVMDDFLKNI